MTCLYISDSKLDVASHSCNTLNSVVSAKRRYHLLAVSSIYHKILTASTHRIIIMVPLERDFKGKDAYNKIEVALAGWTVRKMK